MFLSWIEAGGRVAAEELSARVKDYLKTLEFDLDCTEVVARVYADIKQLEEARSKNKPMTTGDGLQPFVRGFGSENNLFDIIDVDSSHESVEERTWGRYHLQDI